MLFSFCFVTFLAGFSIFAGIDLTGWVLTNYCHLKYKCEFLVTLQVKLLKDLSLDSELFCFLTLIRVEFALINFFWNTFWEPFL